MRVLFTAGEKEGQVVEVPLEEAWRYLDLQVARRTRDDLRTTDIEREYAAEKAAAAAAARPKRKRRPNAQPETTGEGEGTGEETGA